MYLTSRDLAIWGADKEYLTITKAALIWGADKEYLTITKAALIYFKTCLSAFHEFKRILYTE